jgi:hypothetical protein
VEADISEEFVEETVVMSRRAVEHTLTARQDGVCGEPEMFLHPRPPTEAEDFSEDSEAQRGISTPSTRGERLCALNVQLGILDPPSDEGVGSGRL